MNKIKKRTNVELKQKKQRDHALRHKNVFAKEKSVLEVRYENEETSWRVKIFHDFIKL